MVVTSSSARLHDTFPLNGKWSFVFAPQVCDEHTPVHPSLANFPHNNLFISTWHLHDKLLSSRSEARFPVREVVRCLRNQ
jgi:hypothetical protein